MPAIAPGKPMIETGNGSPPGRLGMVLTRAISIALFLQACSGSPASPSAAGAAEQATRASLERIRRIDHAGPALRSVIEVNRDAVAIARELDAEQARGRVRGALHGSEHRLIQLAYAYEQATRARREPAVLPTRRSTRTGRGGRRRC